MSVDLSMTMTAAVPSPLFSATRLSKSISTLSQVDAGAAVQINLDVIAGAAGILADQPGGIGFLDCRLKVLRLVIELAADIDVDGGASHAGTGQHAAFQ